MNDVSAKLAVMGASTTVEVTSSAETAVVNSPLIPALQHMRSRSARQALPSCRRSVSAIFNCPITEISGKNQQRRFWTRKGFTYLPTRDR